MANTSITSVYKKLSYRWQTARARRIICAHAKACMLTPVTPFPICVIAECILHSRSTSKGIGIIRRNPKTGSIGARPFGIGVWLVDPRNTPLLHLCYRAEFGRSSYFGYTSIMSVLHPPEKFDASRLPFKVTQGHQSRHGSNGFERDFLLALTFGLSYNVPRYSKMLSKIVIFLTQPLITPCRRDSLWNMVRVPVFKNYWLCYQAKNNMFDDIFSCLDTMHKCDRQTDGWRRMADGLRKS